MAIGTPTDRGVAQTTPGVSATNTVTSSSFTPTGGNRVIVVVGCTAALGTAVVFTLSDTFTGTGTWTEVANNNFAFDATYFHRTAIWTAVLGGSPGTGTVTVTRNAGTVDQWMCAQYVDVSGTGGTGTTGSSGGKDTTSPVNVTLGASPASTSLLVGGCFSGADVLNNVAPPTGWTELSETRSPSSWFAIHEAAYKLGSGAQSNDWTITDTLNGMGAVAAEFTEAATGTTVLPTVLYRGTSYAGGTNGIY